ncbi:tetratricopeptide repeat protein [Mangrovibacterium marinum]|uniref:AraC-like DNA-binding protein n=1 Tax=Mangrovibacterium marinum TaxID=1639118 RepID=A0A2T5C2U5_9BACT|nr:tetratricopeptide repeat protein [Mangrovibacterium marinum]PTN09073.1 AraC-like DNA-binding protein [Mangrovibacterium marinum]
MKLSFQPFTKKQASIWLVFALLIFLYSCEKTPALSPEIESIKEFYDKAEKQTVLYADSAALMLDSGINRAIQIKHDSLTVAGLFRKADLKEKQGLSRQADSIYSMLIYGKRFNIDSSAVNKIKLHYAHFNQLNGDQTKALKLCTEALEFFKQTNNNKTVVLGNIYLSDIFTLQNEYPKAMDALMEGLAIAEKIGDTKSLALLYGSLGKMYFRQQDYEKCLDCFNKVLTFNTQLENIENIAVTNQNIGTILLIQEKYNEAEKYLLEADKVLSKAGLNSKQVHVLNSLGALYERQQKYDLAIDTYTQVLELNKELNNPYIRSNVYTNIGNVYYDQRNWTKTEYFYNKSYQSLIESGENDFRDYYENMMILNDEKRNYKEAYKWARKFHNHSDSLFNIEKYQVTENLRNKYEAEKKDLQLAKMTIEKQKDNATLLKNRVLLISISALLLLTIIFSLVYYWQNRLKLQSYKELVKKNDELVAVTTEKRRQILVGENSKPSTHNEPNVGKPDLSAELVQSIKQKLNELIDQKFYQNPGTTLNETARELHTNTSYLSQVINDSFSCNFPTFINQLRVEEAQRLLRTPEFDRLSIEGIGNKAGFKSKSAFNSAFKKLTGVTPSVYKNTAFADLTE